MDIAKLRDAGLNDKESRIYVKLLYLNEATVSRVAKETSINRSLLYFILSDMEARGFVSYIIKSNVRFYGAVEPEKILNILEEKKSSFQSIMPDLVKLSKLSGERPRIEILEGKEGIKTILNEILRLNKDWYAFNVPGKGPEILGPSVHAFEIQRQKKGIRLKTICTNSKDGRKRAKEFSAMKHTQVKIIKEKYDSPASNYIYADRLVIIFWYEQFPFAIRIIDKNLAKSYIKYFEYLWGLSEKL